MNTSNENINRLLGWAQYLQLASETDMRISTHTMDVDGGYWFVAQVTNHDEKYIVPRLSVGENMKLLEEMMTEGNEHDRNVSDERYNVLQVLQQIQLERLGEFDMIVQTMCRGNIIYAWARRNDESKVFWIEYDEPKDDAKWLDFINFIA